MKVEEGRHMPLTQMSTVRWRIDCVVGARPNFVKIAPILSVLRARPGLSVRLIHTGQHYDVAMNAVFFDELNIPAPDINLEVGSGTGIEQTARVMLALEPVLTADRPDMLIVVGDVNSTLAASLVSAKLLIPVAHVEAGLRSNDRTMPEEINRLATDRLSDLLLTTEEEAAANLIREGVAPEKIHFVGNVMIDTLYACAERAEAPAATFAESGASPAFLAAAGEQGFGFATLHRPSNVDHPVTLAAIVGAIVDISHKLPLVFAMHPRTRGKIESANLEPMLRKGRILVTPPLSYLKSLGIMREARLVVTDSGGLQDETTALGVPCLTVRDNTERPITIAEGTNTLVGTSPQTLLAAVQEVLTGGGKRGRVPPLWDGRAAQRVADRIEAFLEGQSPKTEALAPASL
jgi:UDP-N-acetylglucosamine 2-epimerase (non-hydrolysing)